MDGSYNYQGYFAQNTEDFNIGFNPMAFQNQPTSSAGANAGHANADTGHGSSGQDSFFPFSTESADSSDHFGAGSFMNFPPTCHQSSSNMNEPRQSVESHFDLHSWLSSPDSVGPMASSAPFNNFPCLDDTDHCGLSGDCASDCGPQCSQECESQCGEESPPDICHLDHCTPECHQEDCNPATRCTKPGCDLPSRANSPDDAYAAQVLGQLGQVGQPGQQPVGPSPCHPGGFASTTHSPGAVPPAVGPFFGHAGCSDTTAPWFPQFLPLNSLNLGWEPSVFNQTYNHILQHHRPNAGQFSCGQPCELDNLQFPLARCPLPQLPSTGMDRQGGCFNTGMNYHSHDPMLCGTGNFTTPEELVSHFNQQHRTLMEVGRLPNSHCASQPPEERGKKIERAQPSISSAAGMGSTVHGGVKSEPALRQTSSDSDMPPSLDDEGTVLPSPSTSLTLASPSTPLLPDNERCDDEETKLDVVHKCMWVDADDKPCNELFDSEEALQNHCQSQHIDPMVRPSKGAGFPCCWKGCDRHPGAGTGFPQKTKLVRHLITHTGYKPHKCRFCDKRLSGLQALQQHERIHTGEAPWQCDWPGCKQWFKQKSAYTMHKRTHTGEKPLKCEYCGKRFSESSNLAKHKRTHNLQGLHRCDICGRDFHRLDQKRKHEKTHHEGKAKRKREKALVSAVERAGLGVGPQEVPVAE